MKTGWLSPSAEWYPCPVYDHIYLAEKLSGEAYRADDALLRKGWVKISITQLGRREWRIMWLRPWILTPEQRQFLEPYFAPDSELPVDDYTRSLWEEE